MAIDLEKLAAELTDAGILCSIADGRTPGMRYLHLDREHAQIDVWSDGGVNSYAAPLNWMALDIIRKHLTPPPDGPAGTRSGVGGTEVRERIREAVKDAQVAYAVEHGGPLDTRLADRITDAVLSCLGLAGDREGGTR